MLFSYQSCLPLYLPFQPQKRCIFLSLEKKSMWKLHPTLYDPTDCSLPGSSVHGILQARILEWVAISSSRESSWYRDWIHVSCMGRWIIYHWIPWEATSLSYWSHYGPYISCCGEAVLLVFRSFSEEIDPYMAIDFVCLWRRCVRDLPTLPSWITSWM